MPPRPTRTLLLLSLLTTVTACSHQSPATIPHLQTIRSVTQLYVHDQPFLALGGELGNSTASDLPTLDAALARCQRMHLNTVMLPVCWDLVEPHEGHYDFTLVKGAIDRARAHHLHLVFLWFGTWKNSMSCYAPTWVKRDPARFPRVRLSTGQPVEIITPESTNARDADARAFATLMRWTRQYDSTHHTVLMVQVENEIGMIPEPRDHSPLSDHAYHSQVPQPLLTLATTGQLGPELTTLWQTSGRHPHGTWPEVFGPSPAGQEVFSAWQFSTYVQHVLAAGKREYPLPMFANAALIRPHYEPGQYPSAGPLPHLLQVWHAGAPSLDFISPDIYFPNFMDWSARYTRDHNPLFIPETAPSARAPANALYAIAHLSAIGVGPFSIETISPEREQQISACYHLLSALSPLILHAQQTHTHLGLSPQIAFDWTTPDTPQTGQLDDILFTAHFDHPSPSATTTSATTLPTLGTGRWDAPPNTPLGSALILQLSKDEFLIAGSGTTLTFSPAAHQGQIGLDHTQELRLTPADALLPSRHLNGDETHQGRHIHLPPGEWTAQRVTLYHY